MTNSYIETERTTEGCKQRNNGRCCSMLCKVIKTPLRHGLQGSVDWEFTLKLSTALIFLVL